MKTKLLITLFAFTLFPPLSQAQSLVGLWGVDQVTVGGEIMTPVAKWFLYEKDNTYRGGNGWLQNDQGTWTYDKSTKEFTPATSIGMKDEYGPFVVRFEGEKMYWEREEEGMRVVVTLSKLNEMPMSPKDRMQGMWRLVSASQNGEDITSTYDPNGKNSIFIRWTQTYRLNNADGSRSSGYWHMDPHAPEFHLIDYNREKPVEVYSVSFEGDQLTLSKKDDSGLVLVYQMAN